MSDVEGARQERFQSILRKHGVVATLRREKGHDIAAACGQLRLQTNRAARTSIILTSSFLLFEKRGKRASFKSGFQADAD